MATTAALTVLGQKNMKRRQRKESQSPISKPGCMAIASFGGGSCPAAHGLPAGSSCILLGIEDSIFPLPLPERPEKSVTNRYSPHGSSGATGKGTEHT